MRVEITPRPDIWGGSDGLRGTFTHTATLPAEARATDSLKVRTAASNHSAPWRSQSKSTWSLCASVMGARVIGGSIAANSQQALGDGDQTRVWKASLARTTRRSAGLGRSTACTGAGKRLYHLQPQVGLTKIVWRAGAASTLNNASCVRRAGTCAEADCSVAPAIRGVCSGFE
jgi:hypothetical protein